MNFCFSSKKDSISDLFWSERIDNQWFNLDKDIIVKYLKYSSVQKFYNNNLIINYSKDTDFIEKYNDENKMISILVIGKILKLILLRELKLKAIYLIKNF